MVEAEGGWVRIPESIALERFRPEARFYYMDGLSWGNLLKNAAEWDGRIREYEGLMEGPASSKSD